MKYINWILVTLLFSYAGFAVASESITCNSDEIAMGSKCNTKTRGYYTPVKGGDKITVTQGNMGTGSHYGNDNAAFAVDFASGTSNFDVYAAKSGTVVKIGIDSSYKSKCGYTWTSPGAGYVVVKHDDNLYAYYYHLLVKDDKVDTTLTKDSRVVRGVTKIGTASDTGCTSKDLENGRTGIHLHFQISKQSNMNRGESVPAIFEDIGDPKNGVYTSQNYPDDTDVEQPVISEFDNISNYANTYKEFISGKKHTIELQGSGFMDSKLPNHSVKSAIYYKTGDGDFSPIKNEALVESNKKIQFSFQDGGVTGIWYFQVRNGIKQSESISIDIKPATNAVKQCFKDLPVDSPYATAICNLADRGILTGDSRDTILNINDRNIRPNDEIIRAEFVAIAMRAIYDNIDGACGDTDYINLKSKFSDVIKTEWYCSPLNKASTDGFIKGYPDGTFKPTSNISNKEAAKVIFTSVLGVKPVFDQEGGETFWINIAAPSYEDCANKLWGVSSFAVNAKRAEVFEWLYKAIELKEKATTGQTFDMQTCAFK